MKYFKKYYLSPHHLSILNRALYTTASKRVVEYGGNFVQVSSHASLVRYKDADDPLVVEFARLRERTKEVFFKFLDGGRIELWNYDYEKLSPAFKRFMKEHDEIMYHRYFDYLQKGVPTEEYDKRLEKLERYKSDYSDEDFENYVMLGRPVPTPNYKKAYDSARRAYAAVNSYLKSNVHTLTNFVTLTFAQEQNKDKHINLGSRFDYVDGTDFDIAKKAFTDYMRNLQRRLPEKMKYICVWEIQRNGNYHFHLLTSGIPKEEYAPNPAWLDYDTISRKYENSIGLINWMHGKSDVQRIRDSAKMSTYISKYLLKGFMNISDDEEKMELYKGQKKYFVSRGLVKPTVIYTDDYDLEMESVISEYNKEVVNPYSGGVIQHGIYTMAEIEKKSDALAPDSADLSILFGV